MVINCIRECITNILVFDNTLFEYDKINLLSKNIIFIDKGGNPGHIKNYISCLFIPEFENSSKFLMFWIVLPIFFRKIKNECFNNGISYMEYPWIFNLFISKI